ncbi:MULTISPECIES: ABC transporter permease [Arthrobacter]|uniref:ABC transporter permease n=1 Tax=Arthrobacter jinronghuae TaxID=2964609 RepID=A0ABT1NMD8_9MICC|nr:MULTISPECIES: ABC transporter permease [Arthrobacter]MCQ1948883.1 ABC transporter permease [Arthrobacter jinronghuae]MCQ1952209.1 ABC transporter permease [Arthrobacter sp. zg-Y238]UWX78312.1 ABC transporter permease [Arthrobacter jinronghuae]
MTNPTTSVPLGARRSLLWLRFGPALLGTCGILGFLGIWQAASVTGIVDPRHLPPPTVVFARFFENLAYTQFWVATGHTLRAWILGVLISSVGGLVLGVIIGSSRFLVRATHSTIEFLRPIPAVALIPLAALLFGPRLGSELMIIIYACFWVVLIQVLYGIADLDRVAMDTARTLRLSFLQRVRYVVFPTLLPYLMTGLRLAATVALVLAISVELIVGTPGLGQEVAFAQINGSAPAIYALIITSGLLGIAINSLMRFIERKSLFWHESVRGGAA